MTDLSSKKTVILRALHSIKSIIGRVLANQNRANPWENPSEATPAMKRAIEQIKNRFNKNESWDSDFSL